MKKKKKRKGGEKGNNRDYRVTRIVKWNCPNESEGSGHNNDQKEKSKFGKVNAQLKKRGRKGLGTSNMQWVWVPVPDWGDQSKKEKKFGERDEENCPQNRDFSTPP